MLRTTPDMFPPGFTDVRRSPQYVGEQHHGSARHRSDRHLDESLWETDTGDLTPNKAEDEGSQESEPGMTAEVRQLYRIDFNFTWEDWTADMAKRAASTNQKFALIARKERNTDAESGVELQSITIQSPLLKDVMRDTFDDYKDLATQLKSITFKRPFHEFVYRWSNFIQRSEKEANETAEKHIELLRQVLEPEILPHLDHKVELEEHEIVSYEYLWLLFPPDSTVYSKVDGTDRTFQLAGAEYERGGFTFSCRFVSCNGDAFGYESETLIIPPFRGHKSIFELDVIPLKHHPDRQRLDSQLLARGKLFEHYKGCHYMTYNGFEERLTPRGWQKHNVDNGRIVIDAKLFRTHNPGFDIGLDPLESDITDQRSSIEDPLQFTMFRGEYDRLRRRTLQMKYSETPGTDAAHSSTLSDHQYRLCTPLLYGYCLSTKKWARFWIDQVSDIRWSGAAFHRLVLPLDYKELILAFVESHIAQGTSFDDIIEGKGRGIIMLLHGDPGVGKTLTAEAVAEEIKKPLYAMSAGELGWDAGSLEENLEKILEVCTKWNAVLLIDECDVFLEKRSTSDLERNKLVSVFLRLLEYYKGVLILTTNRATIIDAAMNSRIDVKIGYPALDFAAKKRIWQTFATVSDDFPHNTSTLTEEDVNRLAGERLNGRQIKNLVKTSRLLAQRRGQVLGMDHLSTALRVHAMAANDVGAGVEE